MLNFSLWLNITRRLFVQEGSDCIRSGGGTVPYFYSCIGCPIGSAQQCVLDMRRNLSFNVAPDCTLGELGASVGNPGRDHFACCAKDGRRETYAYPDALRCLRNLKCLDSHIYLDLKAECDRVCANQWDRACVPSSFSSALRHRPSLLLLVGVPLLLLNTVCC